MTTTEIIARLPYKAPFLFVDEILRVNEDGIVGSYTFRKSENFYEGHFVNHPVTPGVILTEVMAQIGVVCLGIFLLKHELNLNSVIALTSTEIEFLKPVYPEEKVTVISVKQYFRFGKLKCDISMTNSDNVVVCKGTIAGIVQL